MTVMACANSSTARPKPGSVLSNVILFQAGWFACVWSAAQGWPWTGTTIALLIAAAHVIRAARPGDELRLIAMALLIGTVADSVPVAAGWISYASGSLVEGFAPHWILALWLLFATTLNVSMRWLKQRLLLAALLGAIAGPFSYWAATRLGALQFLQPIEAISALSAGWAVIMPLLMALSRRYDGILPAKIAAPHAR